MASGRIPKYPKFDKLDPEFQEYLINVMETTPELWDEVDSDKTKSDLMRWFKEYKAMHEENKPKPDSEIKKEEKVSASGIGFFALPDDALHESMKKLNLKQLGKAAPTSRAFKALAIASSPDYAAILRGKQLLDGSKECPANVRKVLDTQNGLLALGKDLLTMKDILLHVGKEQEKINRTDIEWYNGLVREYERPDMGTGLDPTRYLKLLLSDNGISALEKAWIPKDFLITLSKEPIDSMGPLSHGNYAFLKLIVSDTALIIFQENLLTFQKLWEIHTNISFHHDVSSILIYSLLSDPGLAALKAGLDISFVLDFARIDHGQLLANILRQPNGLTALTEKLITVEQMTVLDGQQFSDALSTEALQRARDDTRGSYRP